MKITLSRFPDGVTIIHMVAETAEDRLANQMLIDRYDTVPVINGESILGSWTGTGAFLDLKVHPFTPEEMRDHAFADAFIEALNARATETPEILALP